MKTAVSLPYISYTWFIIIPLFSVLISCTGFRELPTADGHFSQDLNIAYIDKEKFVYYPGTQVMITAAYNKDSLMIWLKADDVGTTAGFIVNGLSVWLDPEARKNKDIGVIYPSISISEIQSSFKREKDTLNREGSFVNEGFDNEKLINTLKRRRIVLQSGDRAGFADKDAVNIFIDEHNKLNYVMTLPLSFAGIKDPENTKLSIGVVSESDQKDRQQDQRRQPGTMGRPGSRNMHPSAYHPPRNSKKPEQEIKTVNSWMIFILGGEEE